MKLSSKCRKCGKCSKTTPHNYLSLKKQSGEELDKKFTNKVGAYDVEKEENVLWRACNLTAFIHSLTGPVGQPLVPVMRDLGSIPRGVLM